MLITISGTQGSGKTTLTAELRTRLVVAKRHCYVLPSFSHGLVDACKAIGINKFDDINALGYRALFQDFILARVVQTYRDIGRYHENDPSCIVIVDRWLLDTIAYSITELTPPQYAAWLTNLKRIANDADGQLYDRKIIKHHFITKYSNWDKEDVKLSRATSDPLIIEQAILDNRSQFADHYTILDQSSTGERVNAILGQIL